MSHGAAGAAWELLRIDRCDNKEVDEETGDLIRMIPPAPEQIASFHVAVLRGDNELVRQFIKGGMPLDCPNHQVIGSTARTAHSEA